MRLDTTETLHTEQRPDVWRGNADTAGWHGCVAGGGTLLSRGEGKLISHQYALNDPVEGV